MSDVRVFIEEEKHYSVEVVITPEHVPIDDEEETVTRREQERARERAVRMAHAAMKETKY